MSHWASAIGHRPSAIFLPQSARARPRPLPPPQVLEHNGALLPPEALFIIRYHSFYALHQHGAYQQLLSEQDARMLPWLRAFQQCDLYSKSGQLLDVQALKPYYMGLIRKWVAAPVRGGRRCCLIRSFCMRCLRRCAWLRC